MFKRVIWMGTGFGVGLGSSFWVKRAVNRKVQQYIPADVRSAVGDRARSATRTVVVAVHEGRAVMRQYQAEAEARVTGVETAGGEGEVPVSRSRSSRSVKGGRRPPLRAVPD